LGGYLQKLQGEYDEANKKIRDVEQQLAGVEGVADGAEKIKQAVEKVEIYEQIYIE
jgi:hypothetical protein